MSQLARQMKMVDIEPDVEDTWNNLGDSTVMQKYQAAAAFTNGNPLPLVATLFSTPLFPYIEALRLVLSQCQTGASLAQLCRIGDDHIMKHAAKVFVKGNIERGIAFPTCICVNGVVANCSPLSDEADEARLAIGDVVKVELGAHVDGYAATAAHTIVIAEDSSKPVTGRKADVLAAAYLAAEAAVRLIKVGADSRDVWHTINEVAQAFRVAPVEGTASHLLKRFLLEADQAIPNSFDPAAPNDFTFGENEVISINIVFSTGTGSNAIESPYHSSTLLQRDVNAAQGFKLKSSRATFNHVVRTFGVYPFSTRALLDMDTQHRLGLPELLKSGVLVSRPVYIEENETDIVAQFKITVALLPKGQGTFRLTAPLNPPYVHSTKSVDSRIEKLVKQDVKVARAKAPASSSNETGMDLS
ncbi:peptidase M24, structural domain-containing protein [Chytriomyces sp. MP71]|nr:peptidase M24, structural domain-containing protein [Chytriomyces sp. MP71]